MWEREPVNNHRNNQSAEAGDADATVFLFSLCYRHERRGISVRPHLDIKKYTIKISQCNNRASRSPFATMARLPMPDANLSILWASTLADEAFSDSGRGVPWTSLLASISPTWTKTSGLFRLSGSPVW
ncbi:hypothetical protein EVAR_87087_1 [Eumeta japonica]|uniref:Uncharacterized protein n=1 Tax=Eumeta variegata TaxID=151549 RepID=A0A4C1VSN0_EUMVA|nr:hypothetical protein EVAR_87087_1 [Eumeta japonica]